MKGGREQFLDLRNGSNKNKILTKIIVKSDPGDYNDDGTVQRKMILSTCLCS